MTGQQLGSSTQTGAIPATPSTLVQRDSSGNVTANALSVGIASTATAAGTTTLTIADKGIQVWTGSTTQTVKLATTGVGAGYEQLFINLSTGAVTVQSSGANTILVLAPGTSALFIAGVATPTTAANWDYVYWTGPTSAQTLTATRLQPRIGTTASSATPTASADNHDQFNVTALAVGATFGAPTGTPTDGQKMPYRIKDNGSPQTLAYNAIFRALGVTLPTVTVANKTLYLGTMFNAADTKWDVVAVGQEA